jgi:hypothetical protein
MLNRLRHLLGLVSLVTVAAVVVVTLVDFPPLRLIAGLLLVFVLPGAGFATAVFPPGRAGRVEWIVAAVALSIGLNIMGGFVLHLSPFGLTGTSWALLLGAVALVTDMGRHSKARWRQPMQLSGTMAAQGGLLLAAVGVAGGALLYSAESLVNQPRPSYTVLSAQQTDDQAGAAMLKISVSNAEGDEASYRLSAQQDGAELGAWPSIQLRAGEAWTGGLTLPTGPPATTPIVATLYRGESDTMYRQVLIWPNEASR